MDGSLISSQFLILVASEITLNNDITIETHSNESIDGVPFFFRHGDTDLPIRSGRPSASASFRSAELIHKLIVHSLHLVRSSFETFLQELHKLSLILIDELKRTRQ